MISTKLINRFHFYCIHFENLMPFNVRAKSNSSNGLYCKIWSFHGDDDSSRRL